MALTFRQKLLAILAVVRGKSQKEIAAHLGISESTVEKQVAKGLLMCARFMDAKGYPVTSGRARRTPPPAPREKKG